ncbi:unnamed protein product [Moneuplotes crassus]|uniref:Kelch repeat-containing protein n=1 Tax=Euplotes crassus TaxID=5936 RepID=A0AAD1Y4X5_EUPCR|nr:unnamed protein product [Moneuplotes crassus]
MINFSPIILQPCSCLNSRKLRFSLRNVRRWSIVTLIETSRGFIKETQTLALQVTLVFDSLMITPIVNPQVRIEDKWINKKGAKIVPRFNPNKMTKTSQKFFDISEIGRSHISTQGRKEFASQGRSPCKNNYSFYNSNTPSSGYGVSRERKSSADGFLINNEQKLRYTMDELKLTCNKPTFLKFYQIKRTIKKRIRLAVQVQEVKSKLWRPQVREEFTLDVTSTPDGLLKGYLIGGFNGNGIKQISTMTIQLTFKPMMDWRILQVKNHDELQSKFSQATCVDEKYIYIFGGADLALKNTKSNADGTNTDKVLHNQKLNISRQCTSQLMRFDTQRNELKSLPQGDYIVSPKRDHCIAKFGRFIISFGGINNLGRVLEDLDIYDLNLGEWEPLKVKNPIEGICYTACAAIFYPDRSNENKDKLEISEIPPPNWGEVEHLIKEEGIYLFGGRNKNSEVDGSLRILKLGNPYPKNYWKYPDTLGRPPCPRYQHCMVHLPKLNLLVIHGGRTSLNTTVTPDSQFQNFFKRNSINGLQLPKRSSPKCESFVLGDIFALRLDNFEWIRVAFPNENQLARANHSMAKLGDDSLIILGGTAANSTYCSSDYLFTFTEENIPRRSSCQQPL